MKFSVAWLNEWVKADNTKLAQQLTMLGLEVDSESPVAADFTGVKVGFVLEREQHPDADRLSVCKVDVGAAEPLQIVCGASNVRAGLKVAVAVEGAVLPGDFKIKKTKLRGVESLGMICSESELGLADSSNGIMELPEDAPVGENFRHYFQLDDRTIEIDLTPNRGDCLSLRGIAREIAAIHETDLIAPPISAVAASIDEQFSIHIEDKIACPNYVGRVIKNINPRAKTPLWMKEQLRRSGVRPIAPVVDVTNFVMLELGQPMHAFDLDKLNSKVVVRRAHAGETIQLLNSEKVTLTDDLLVIADDKSVIAIAGIMGGADSSVTDDTRHIFLESAFFTQAAVAGKARQLAIHTDSSTRFERGVDPQLQVVAIERATNLLLAIVGGEAGPVCQQQANKFVACEVELQAKRIKQILGIEISATRVESILKRLDFTVKAKDDGWFVTVPSHRFDVSQQDDLIEEIARIYGYHNIPSLLPVTVAADNPNLMAQQNLRHIKNLLTAQGYYEAITYSFVDEKLQQLFNPAQQAIALANPISQDMNVMRTNLWSGLVQALKHNKNRQQERVRLFEVGLKFCHDDHKQLQQQQVISGLCQGNILPEQWGSQERLVDFYDVKAELHNVFVALGIENDISYQRANHLALHPGKSANILFKGVVIGCVGAINPTISSKLKLTGPVYLFELVLTFLIQSDTQVKLVVPSKYPSVRRDLAVVLDQAISAAELIQTIESAAGKLLKTTSIFDVYAGEGIEKGRKSLALSLLFQDPDRTLVDSEINDAFNSVVNKLESTYQAELRK